MAEDRPKSGITPHLTIRDGRCAEAITFYAAAFGAEERSRQAEAQGERLMHAALVINGDFVLMHDDFPEYRGGAPAPEPASAVLHLAVDDADAWWARAVDAGAEVTMPLADQFWGDRYGHLKDPFGYTWSIGAPIKA
ncbi:MAG: VOC family protein [Pseudomonadota bacterium]|nr:VOC family protein [Pseudomonadota bacterium]